MRFYLQLKLALLATLIIASLAGPSAMAEKAEIYRFGMWKLHTHFDTFNGQMVCQLHTDYVDFDGHVLSFHLNGNPSSVDAEVRINSGPILHAGDYQESLESTQIFYQSGPLNSRDDGVLRMPARLFAEAAYVDVRANPRLHIKHFNFDGFPAALAYMRAHGCATDETRN